MLSFIQRIITQGPAAPGPALAKPAPKRPVAQLVGKTETFTHRPGKLSADLELTPAREDEMIKRRDAINKAHTETTSAAMKTFAKVTTDAALVRDQVVEAADNTRRKALRRLYAEFMEFDGEEEVAKSALETAIADGDGVAAETARSELARGMPPRSIAQVAAAVRRRVRTAPEAEVSGDGIPNQLETVIQEQKEREAAQG